MNIQYYDCEECFRALALILMKNNVFYITQEAFEMYIKVFKFLLNKKGIKNEIFGELNFACFTDFTRSMGCFEDADSIVILNCYKKDEFKKSVFRKELFEIAEEQKALSVFGISDDLFQNIKLCRNNLNHQQFELVKSRLKFIEKLNNPLFFNI